MKSILTLFLIVSFLIPEANHAQGKKTDSASVAGVLRSLLSACKNVDFKDPNTTKLGTFYKAAPYILYQGNDDKRAYKSFADYSKPEDKKGVDEVCVRINESVNRDGNFRIVKYITEKESEGVWHILVVDYKKNNAGKKASFAFLKIGGRFGLGDID
jgi:hypothetical protein